MTSAMPRATSMVPSASSTSPAFTWASAIALRAPARKALSLMALATPRASARTPWILGSDGLAAASSSTSAPGPDVRSNAATATIRNDRNQSFLMLFPLAGSIWHLGTNENDWKPSRLNVCWWLSADIGAVASKGRRSPQKVRFFVCFTQDAKVTLKLGSSEDRALALQG